MAKKSVSKKTSGKTGDVVFTEHAIVITLDAAAKRQAKRCLEKNGKITFSVNEHSVTKLPQLLDNGKQID
ncbi:hypothetical protein [Bradyrhizobium sp.]|jgi:hypothetical protein|uniref:ApyA family aminopyruvatide-related RiPP n=1 Tax=Bradyrhizobium sp. TaxID=376 RepID=UPI003C2839ED